MVLRASNPHEVFMGAVPAREPVAPRMAQQDRIPLTVNQLGAVVCRQAIPILRHGVDCGPQEEQGTVSARLSVNN